jgi:hypothetical protein
MNRPSNVCSDLPSRLTGLLVLALLRRQAQ